MVVEIVLYGKSKQHDTPLKITVTIIPEILWVYPELVTGSYTVTDSLNSGALSDFTRWSSHGDVETRAVGAMVLLEAHIPSLICWLSSPGACPGGDGESHRRKRVWEQEYQAWCVRMDCQCAAGIRHKTSITGSRIYFNVPKDASQLFGYFFIGVG